MFTCPPLFSTSHFKAIFIVSKGLTGEFLSWYPLTMTASSPTLYLQAACLLFYHVVSSTGIFCFVSSGAPTAAGDVFFFFVRRADASRIKAREVRHRMQPRVNQCKHPTPDPNVSAFHHPQHAWCARTFGCFDKRLAPELVNSSSSAHLLPSCQYFRVGF